MAIKRKSFKGVRFPAWLISDIYNRWVEALGDEKPTLGWNEVISEDGEREEFETVASWLDAYRRDPPACTLMNVARESHLNYYFDPDHGSTIEVRLPKVDDVNGLIELLEREASNHRLPEAEPEEVPMPRPHVFIGYGGSSSAWRDLRDFLTQLGVSVETYQSKTRAGQSITVVLEEMLDRANFAFLVHTAEDDVGGGRMRARQNIIHETGLFHGRLGFDRAIIVREEGTEDFSNIHGLQEIRFPPGQIRAAFGDIIEVVRQHFPGV
jgi:predicted nucleotide-binding protein